MKKLFQLQNYFSRSALTNNEAGATLAEYALVTVFIGFAALVIFNLFPAAIRAYVNSIYFVVSQPLP